MNRLYFGSSDKQLYGVYHAPRGQTVRAEGILLCYPFGQEYMRAHRGFRQLALLLSKRGYHVLRFDYFGTGDSAGDGEDISIDQWLEDIDSAAQELKDTADLERVSLVGLRLGATLASQYACNRDDIDGLVLWDPVPRGDSYTEELLTQAAHVTEYDDDIAHINGFPLTRKFRDELCKVDLSGQTGLNNYRTYLVYSHERAEYTTLADVLSKQAGRGAFLSEQVASPGDWNKVDDFGGVLIPQAIIQAIVEWFLRGK